MPCFQCSCSIYIIYFFKFGRNVNLTNTPLTRPFQPNLRGPLDCIASLFGVARRGNLRWYLASSSGKLFLPLHVLFLDKVMHMNFSQYCLSFTTFLPTLLSPLKDAFHLSKKSLISSRNLSLGLAIVGVPSVIVPLGVQHHFKHDVYVSFCKTGDIVMGIDICFLT